MRILYGFSNCSYKWYNSLMEGAKVMILQQAQKYHSLMTKGLVMNGADVECMSGLPVNRSLTGKLWIEGGDDEENGVRYHYFSSPNLPGLRQIVLMVKSFWRCLTAKKPDVAICDILNISILMGMLLGCKLRRIPLIGIVTDVPGHLAIDEPRMQDKIDGWLMKQMDGYVLLTEPMNEVVNPKGKPYVVIEGQVDSSMKEMDNRLEDKRTPKVVMYAGSMQRIYGLPKLVDAFKKANVEGWELHVYGDGDFLEEYERLCEKDPRLKYKGICSNAEIVEAERRASLLVNPRPTNEDFVKYSFPSKNMEYIVSGTPLLTTHLPGMPDEYLPYLYVWEREDVESMAEELVRRMKQPDMAMSRLGHEAKYFVLKEKNERVQAQKVVMLAKSMIRNLK